MRFLNSAGRPKRATIFRGLNRTSCVLSKRQRDTPVFRKALGCNQFQDDKSCVQLHMEDGSSLAVCKAVICQASTVLKTQLQRSNVINIKVAGDKTTWTCIMGLLHAPGQQQQQQQQQNSSADNEVAQGIEAGLGVRMLRLAHRYALQPLLGQLELWAVQQLQLQVQLHPQMPMRAIGSGLTAVVVDEDGDWGYGAAVTAPMAAMASAALQPDAGDSAGCIQRRHSGHTLPRTDAPSPASPWQHSCGHSADPGPARLGVGAAGPAAAATNQAAALLLRWLALARELQLRALLAACGALAARLPYDMTPGGPRHVLTWLRAADEAGWAEARTACLRYCQQYNYQQYCLHAGQVPCEIISCLLSEGRRLGMDSNALLDALMASMSGQRGEAVSSSGY